MHCASQLALLPQQSNVPSWTH